MVSILTNSSAIAALQTLRSLTSHLDETQQNISSGLRIGEASDNAAYWSIATTMRSDNKSLSAVHDALGLSAAIIDTAYAGLNSVIDILGEFSAKLVASKQDGVDKGKVQKELDQLKQAVTGIANSASFNGQNWLKTDLSDIFDPNVTRTSLVASTTRNGAGDFATQMLDFSLADVSLFNSTGGGLLQRDPRDVNTIGGIRSFDPDPSYDATPYIQESGEDGWMFPVSAGPRYAGFSFDFPAKDGLDFSVPGAEIQFDLILDQEASNPYGSTGTTGNLQEIPGPFSPGVPFTGITITKADVDASLGVSVGGIVKTNTEFAKVLNDKLNTLGASVSADGIMPDPTNDKRYIHDPEHMAIWSLELHGPGSYIEIANLTTTNIGTGGLVEKSRYGQRGSGKVLDFKSFQLGKVGDTEEGVRVDFKFSINGQPATSHSFDRAYVNTLLNRDDGRVETADDMVTLLKSLLDADWKLVIEAASPNEIIIKSDPDFDRETGYGSSLAFSNIRVNIEPIPSLNFLSIDVAEHPESVDAYITYMNTATQRIIDGTSSLGALRSRVDRQTDFVQSLMDANTSGIGTLVDADMNHESTRLKALQVQQQLSIQALQIANSQQQSILQLFN
ncbi:flagellin [Rhizobium rhizoryzae]|uniref:Flagellin n=1 Tax=Rhizobium rhizoryzae TaxID=451876 RepID=A0A7W6PQG7_9HYPH|nr:flagellin [Rhizobium rhizoryzae]MBB4142904.1 flagellin [Rhizobium rhizoryzae]